MSGERLYRDLKGEKMIGTSSGGHTSLQFLSRPLNHSYRLSSGVACRKCDQTIKINWHYISFSLDSSRRHADVALISLTDYHGIATYVPIKYFCASLHTLFRGTVVLILLTLFLFGICRIVVPCPLESESPGRPTFCSDRVWRLATEAQPMPIIIRSMVG